LMDWFFKFAWQWIKSIQGADPSQARFRWPKNMVFTHHLAHGV
jgi:hypothetical protein